MIEVRPPVYTADLWSPEDRFGKTLDAMFAMEVPKIAGLMVGYICNGGNALVTGPIQFATLEGSTVRILEDLPEQDAPAALMGRSIQAALSAYHVADYLDELQHVCPIQEKDHTLGALFVPDGLILFHDDPWEVTERYPLESHADQAAAQLCTIVMRPADSAHQVLARGKGMAASFSTLDAFQATANSMLMSEKGVRLAMPSAAELSQALSKAA